MKERLQEFINLSYSIEVVPGQTTDGFSCYMAHHPELPGCMSHGDSPEEAIINLMEAKELYIKTLLEKGEEVPLPSSHSPSVIWQAVKMGEISEEEPYIITENVSPLQPLGAPPGELAAYI